MVSVHNLQPGKWYRVEYRSGQQRLRREAKMTFLGYHPYTPRDLMFSARPVGGTQTIPKDWVLCIEECDKPKTPYMNKIIREA